MRKGEKLHPLSLSLFIPTPNAQCPMPNAQCPIPNLVDFQASYEL
ncbi:hypothetical protein [Nostoc sp.]